MPRPLWEMKLPGCGPPTQGPTRGTPVLTLCPDPLPATRPAHLCLLRAPLAACPPAGEGAPWLPLVCVTGTNCKVGRQWKPQRWPPTGMVPPTRPQPSAHGSSPQCTRGAGEPYPMTQWGEVPIAPHLGPPPPQATEGWPTPRAWDSPEKTPRPEPLTPS